MSAPSVTAPPTLRVIEGGAGRRRTAWCDRLPGFGLRRFASGRASWIAQTRMGARTRTVTLGSMAVLSEHHARELARHVLLRAQVGGDPASDRARGRAAPLFDDFVAEYWRSAEPRWKPRTRVRNDEHRRCHLLGRFPGQFIDAIDMADVRRWFVTVSDECGPGTANRAAAVLSNLFNMAERWGHRPAGSNPCTGLRRNRARRFARVLEPDELARLGAALDATAADRPLASAIVRLLLLTGCRVSELLALDWSDVRGTRLTIRDAKAGPRIVWLGNQARDVLARLPRSKDVATIFSNPTTGKRMASPVRYWRGLLNKAALPPARLHDLRHTFASHGARGEETLPMIGRLLGHRHSGTTGRYTHLDEAAILRAADLVGDAVELLTG